MSTAHFSTKERILSAAEILFAQQGFAETSLRQVTSQADVNLAAVNYHFGSKDKLIHEVFRRRLDQLSERRLQALAKAEAEHAGDLRAVLMAFVAPALELGGDRQGGAAFVRMIARAYGESDDRLRRFLADHYGHVMRAFAQALARCLPDIEEACVQARLDYIAGALTYAMTDFGRRRRPDHVSPGEHRQRAADALVAFAEGGLRAGPGAS